MNILAAGMEWIDQTPGGLNRYFADYLAAMTALGHSVRGLIVAGQPTSAPAYMQDVAEAGLAPGTWSRTRAFRSAINAAMRPLPGGAFPVPDVYNPHFALYSSLVTRNMLPQSVPIVTHFHGPWAEEARVEELKERAAMGRQVRYWVKKQVERMTYRRSDHFIVLSRYFEQLLSEGYGISKQNIHIVPGGVDTNRFVPSPWRKRLRETLGIQEGQQVLFCARRLVQRMGLDRLVQAMADVARRHSEAALYIAGTGPQQQRLKQMIADLCLQGTVHLLGQVSNEELVQWYQAADLSIVPTVTLEGFGLVTVESLACGTPVLGTPYGGTKEILEQVSGGLMFADGTSQAMAAKLCAVLSGQQPVPSREACREHVLRHYTWERTARSVTGVFELETRPM